MKTYEKYLINEKTFTRYSCKRCDWTSTDKKDLIDGKCPKCGFKVKKQKRTDDTGVR